MVVGQDAAAVTLRVTARHRGSGSCAVQGWPGVSLVGGENGDQIGVPALRTGGPGARIPLRPGGTASATVRLTLAKTQPSCAVAAARGLRIYLPDQLEAAFAPVSGLQGCADAKTPSLLAVSAFAAG